MSIRRRMAEAMKKVYDSAGGGKQGSRTVERAFREGDFDTKDFSIRSLAEATMGRDWVESGRPTGGAQYLEEGAGGGAVDHTAFSNLTTTVISGLMDEPDREADLNASDDLARTVPTQYEQGEKVIGLRRVGREANRVIRPGESYGRYGFGEDWQMKPDTEKRGGIVELTKEAIVEDRTGRILDAARTLIDEARQNKNERILKAVLGIDNSIFMPKGVAEPTYTTATTGQDDNARVNLVTSGIELLDWTDIDEAQQLWADMRHKDTGRPIQIADGRMRLIVMPAKKYLARQILNATEVETGDVTAAGGRRKTANPLAQEQIDLMVSNLMYELLTRSATDPYNPGAGLVAATAKKRWYMGDFARAFEYLENWPLTAVTMGPGSYAEWDRDVVFGVKVSEKGTPAVNDPRYVLQLRG